MWCFRVIVQSLDLAAAILFSLHSWHLTLFCAHQKITFLILPEPLYLLYYMKYEFRLNNMYKFSFYVTANTLLPHYKQKLLIAVYCDSCKKCANTLWKGRGELTLLKVNVIEGYMIHIVTISLLTLRLLMSYICGTPILYVSRSHTTTQHSR